MSRRIGHTSDDDFKITVQVQFTRGAWVGRRTIECANINLTNPICLFVPFLSLDANVSSLMQFWAFLYCPPCWIFFFLDCWRRGRRQKWLIFHCWAFWMLNLASWIVQYWSTMLFLCTCRACSKKLISIIVIFCKGGCILFTNVRVRMQTLEKGKE